MSKLYDLLKERIVFLDGAFGTELQKRGLSQGDIPELWNVTHKDIIKEIHESYVEAGSDIINTNTFGGTRVKLKELGLEDRIIELNEAAVKIAKDAAGSKALVAGSIGPTGIFLKPFGPMSFKEMYDVYKELVEILVKSGVDIINFETMVDIGELRAAVLAAFDTCDLPVFASMTFDQSGRSLTGSDPVTAFNILEGIGCEFVGTNCGMGPKDMGSILNGVRDHISARLVVQANAGLPVIENGKTVFNLPKEDYVEYAKKFMEYGVSVVGGCCGTTPEFISSLVKEFKTIKPKTFTVEPNIRLSSLNTTIIAGNNRPFLKIGEKINPSASKKLNNQVKQGNLSYAKELAVKQENAGAHVLDVNMGATGIDETQMICKAVTEITSLVKIPLCIDSTRTDAIEEAIKIYPGRALINSISGEKDRIEKILPIMKKYGSYAILLPLDENGIPKTVEERKKIIQTILDEAKKMGVPKERFIVDGLIMTISAAQDMGMLTLETLQMVKNEFGIATTGGLSNIGFGLPTRGIINSNYLAMMMGAGLDSAILNPENNLIKSTIDACNVLTSRDKNAIMFINEYKDTGPLVLIKKKDLNENFAKENENQGTSKNETEKKKIKDPLYNCILLGDADNVVSNIKEYLNNDVNAIEIVNKSMIPAIKEVGDLYDKKEYFLPQLMMSAETMKKGFQHIEPMLKEGSTSSSGKIILATVKGDVHDIGKNIVSIMLSNYGFEVIDLGKDIESQDIIEAAIKESANIIGLSALMTTTMLEMEKFMKILEEKNLDIPVMVGGAVVSDDFAKSIGAHYSKDAVDAVKVAQKLAEKIAK